MMSLTTRRSASGIVSASRMSNHSRPVCMTRAEPPKPPSVPTDKGDRRATTPADDFTSPVRPPTPAPDLPERAISSSQPKSYSFGDAMKFTGPAPELINGRLAMLGFVAGVAAELATGESILDQFRRTPLLIGGVFALVIAASLIPLLAGVNKDKSSGPLTPRAEIFNGQVAMLAFAVTLGLEAVVGRAWWHFF